MRCLLRHRWVPIERIGRVVTSLCTRCGATKPLASWLEDTADSVNNEVRWHEATLACGDASHHRSGFVHSGSTSCGRWLAAGHDRIACGWSACQCFDHALAVARSLLGSTR